MQTQGSVRVLCLLRVNKQLLIGRHVHKSQPSILVLLKKEKVRHFIVRQSVELRFTKKQLLLALLAPRICCP